MSDFTFCAILNIIVNCRLWICYVRKHYDSSVTLKVMIIRLTYGHWCPRKAIKSIKLTRSLARSLTHSLTHSFLVLWLHSNDFVKSLWADEVTQMGGNTATFSLITLQDLEQLCDELISGEWLPSCARPSAYGYYAIWRWVAKTKTWLLLYIGRGLVGNSINNHFAYKRPDKLADSYFSSFPKCARHNIWFTYVKDPHYPYQVILSEITFLLFLPT